MFAFSAAYDRRWVFTCPFWSSTCLFTLYHVPYEVNYTFAAALPPSSVSIMYRMMHCIVGIVDTGSPSTAPMIMMQSHYKAALFDPSNPWSTSSQQTTGLHTIYICMQSSTTHNLTKLPSLSTPDQMQPKHCKVHGGCRKRGMKVSLMPDPNQTPISITPDQILSKHCWVNENLQKCIMGLSSLNSSGAAQKGCLQKQLVLQITHRRHTCLVSVSSAPASFTPPKASPLCSFPGSTSKLPKQQIFLSAYA